MFRLEHSEYLMLLWSIPILVAAYILIAMAKKRNLKHFGEAGLVRELMPDVSRFRYNLKFVLTIIAVSLLIFALSGPQFGSRLVDTKQKGLEIIIALDVSNSMMAEDIQPSRLERAKQELSRLMDRLDNDRIGLIVFAGEAYTQIPITSDIQSAKMFFSGISTQMVTRQGTAIGEAIDLASSSFSPQQDIGKAIIVISDGENHEGEVLEACRKAVGKHIRIFAIGMGLTQGARIPVSSGNYDKDYLRDRDGNFVVTKLNEEMLAQIAKEGNGMYFRASNPSLGLNEIVNQLEKMEQDETTTQTFEEYEEQFPFFAWMAFFVLILDLWITDKRNKWFNKWSQTDKS